MTDVQLYGRGNRAVFYSDRSPKGEGWSMADGIKAGFDMVPTTSKGQQILSSFKAGQQTTNNSQQITNEVMTNIFQVQTALALRKGLEDSGLVPAVSNTQPNSITLLNYTTELTNAQNQMDAADARIQTSLNRMAKLFSERPKKKKRPQKKEEGTEIDDYMKINSSPQDSVVLEQKREASAFSELFIAHRRTFSALR